MSAKHLSTISENPSMPLTSKRWGQRAVGACRLAWLAPLLLMLMGATEINIGTNNQVNTGVIIGGDCLKGNGQVTSEQREVAPFSRVSVDGVFAVHIRSGGRQSLVVEAENNLLPKLRTEVADGRLTITSEGSICTTTGIVVSIELPQLEAIQAGGSSQIVMESEQGDAPLAVDLHGTTAMQLSGRLDSLQVRQKDATELDATNCPVQRLHIEIADASSASLRVTDKLTGESRDVSSVSYWGRPPDVSVQAFDVSGFVAEE